MTTAGVTASSPTPSPSIPSSVSSPAAASSSARRDRLAAARLYLCTDGRRDRGDLAEFLDAVLAGGVDIVQLREKGLEAREELALCQVVADAAARHGALWSVNDRADLAAVARPDVLHVGQGDLTPEQCRRVAGPEVLLGLSTHGPDQLAAAVADPELAYLCVGPVVATPTKPGRPGVGLDLVRRAAATVPSSRPWFVTGGVSEESLPGLVAAGARRFVVVRALTRASDPQAAAAALRREVDRLTAADGR